MEMKKYNSTFTNPSFNHWR